MIKCRLYTPDDFEKVDKFLEKHSFPFPSDNQFLVIAEDENGNIISICGLKQQWKIEPLIAENPFAGNNLLRIIEGIAIGQGITKLYAEIPNENVKHINHAIKDGYKLISTNRTLLEKSYG